MLAYAFKKLSPAYHRVRTWAFRYPVVYGALQKVRRMVKFTYPESALAHKYLDGLRGIEIGGGTFNPFGLDTLNINHGGEDPGHYDYKGHEVGLTGKTGSVDIVALGDRLPFPDGSWDFVLTSHVIEHFHDPIRALQEWYRVVRPGGYVFLVVPHKARNGYDAPRPRTTLAELIARHAEGKPNVPSEMHLCFWLTEDFVALCNYLKLPIVEVQDPDDKVGNGFSVVIRKPASA